MVGEGDKAGRSSRRLPWGFLGMLVLVALVEHAIAGHDRDFDSIMQLDWRVTGKIAKQRSRVLGREILCLGDSLMKFSLMPRIMKDRCGSSALNLAVHTGQTPVSYFLFRRALRAGARPSAIILDLTPHLLIQSPRQNQLLWAELLTAGECFDLTFRMRDPEYLASIAIARLMPSFKDRHEIRAVVKEAFEGRLASRRTVADAVLRNWKLNDGGMLFTDAVSPPIDVDHWVNTLYRTWSPDPVNLAYLDQLLQLAADTHVEVYWLLPPIQPVIQERTEATGFDGEYSKFVEEVHSRFPGTTIVDARHSGFVSVDFSDGVHLNRRGSVKLSAAIADLIRHRDEARQTQSWVNLEPARGAVDDTPLEDVEQSILFVRGRDAAHTR